MSPTVEQVVRQYRAVTSSQGILRLLSLDFPSASSVWGPHYVQGFPLHKTDQVHVDIRHDNVVGNDVTDTEVKEAPQDLAARCMTSQHTYPGTHYHTTSLLCAVKVLSKLLHQQNGLNLAIKYIVLHWLQLSQEI